MGYKRLHTTPRMNKMKHTETEKIGLILFLCTSLRVSRAASRTPRGQGMPMEPEGWGCSDAKDMSWVYITCSIWWGRQLHCCYRSFKARSIWMHKVKPVAQKTELLNYWTTFPTAENLSHRKLNSSTFLLGNKMTFSTFLLVLFSLMSTTCPLSQDTSCRFSGSNLYCSFITSR